MIRRDPDDHRRPSTPEENRERTVLLARWGRPGPARRRPRPGRPHTLLARPYDPATLRAELLSGAVVNVYAFGEQEQRARGYIDHLRREGLPVASLGVGTGCFQLRPGKRPPRSPRRAAMRERLLAGETITYESAAEKTLVYNLVRELRRGGYAVHCLGRGTRSYRLESQLARKPKTSNDSSYRDCAVLTCRSNYDGL